MEKKALKPIYLDYNATTPLDPRVLSKMEPYLKEYFGNPSSAQHQWGWAADSAVHKARHQVASLLNAKENEIYFTSGATESNNWAIFGLINQWREENPQQPIHIITSCIEHSSVLNALKAAQKQGIDVDFLPVNKHGQVDISTIRQAIKPHTKLMSFIWVNNEIGSINPMCEIAALAKEKQIYLHSDGTQAVGKILVDLNSCGIDLLSFSGHKIYGPKGVGALYIRSAQPKVSLQPIFHGGGQEKGLRSGTVNVPGVVGLGEAASICQLELAPENSRLVELRNYFWKEIHSAIPQTRLNGHSTDRSPINLNVSFLGKETELVIGKLSRLGFSTGSACSAGRISISHVLKGLGISEVEAQGTLRLSLGRWTTHDEIDQAVEILKNAFA